jgi:Undecaprenyl-phosphate glucose phosphotransferase
MSGLERLQSPTTEPPIRRLRYAMGELSFSCAVAGMLAGGVLALAVATGIAYHWWFYDEVGIISRYLAVGWLAALLYIVPFVLRDRLDIASVASTAHGIGAVTVGWTAALASVVVIGFLTKTGVEYSRGWALLLYLAGLVVVPHLHRLLAHATIGLVKVGLLEARRVMIVGGADEIGRLNCADLKCAPGITIVAQRQIPLEGATLPELAALVQVARDNAVDDIVLAVPLACRSAIEAAAEAFSIVPARLHLSGDWLADRFGGLKISRLGTLTGLAINEAPLTPLQALVKRAFDIVVSATALVLLAPVFGAVAIAIRLDSKGPVFFRQRRLGYNQREFRIWKFRSMTTLDDGDVVVQARKNDVRVTRVGRWLRATNLDELPQLINVLSGEMSIVGPRPHAIAHDRHYQERIRRYPRRLNVKPGITGWAQINGFRGETDTDEKMARRVEHDLYYIDNWSLRFDVYIMVLTVLSPSSYRNAR